VPRNESAFPPGDEPLPANGQAPHSKFHLVRSKNVKLGTSPNYLIHGWIPREGLILIWGPPKCGKSFWTFDLLMHPALGWEYRCCRVERGTVVYIACEGERGLAGRNAAFWQSRLSEDADPPFYLLTTRLDLPGQVEQLVLDIASQIPPAAMAAIVLDTLNRSIGGSESKDEDMSAYVAAADQLRERFKCAVVIVHHCGIDATRPRGHTSLTGAVDAQIAVKRDASDRIIATVEWMKDGPEGGMFASRLEVVDIGTDDNGMPMTSCIVVPANDEADKATARKRPPLPDGAKIALAQLRKALDVEGVVPPLAGNGHMPTAIHAVAYELWRRYCYTAGIADSQEAKQKAFARAADRLKAEEIVQQWDMWVWIP